MNRTSGLNESQDSARTGVPLQAASTTESTEVEQVDINLTGSAAAIVATEKEIAMYVDDRYLKPGETPPHIAKLNLALLIVNELDRHPDWFRRGLHLVETLKADREKK